MWQSLQKQGQLQDSLTNTVLYYRSHTAFCEEPLGPSQKRINQITFEHVLITVYLTFT